MVIAKSLDEIIFLYTPHASPGNINVACGVHGKRGQHGFFRKMTEKLR